jgi:hypothetical protein
MDETGRPAGAAVAERRLAAAWLGVQVGGTPRTPAA